ncbi:MAG: hypothetical protein KJ622_16650 [Alphaproteobacteria bacterium]|nr:hypothetical protein [Alphaproteobacteria bacterium]
MRKQSWLAGGACEETLARELLPVASELRNFDVADLIAFSRLERSESLKSLVNSAVEQFFKPGNIEILDAGDVRVAWGNAPEIEFNFRFASSPLKLYFRMLLSNSYGAFDVDFIECPADWQDDPQVFAVKFRESLQKARLA